MKKLTLVPIGGLANRIYAMLSMIAFCRNNQIQLQIVWLKERGMGANFHDILTSFNQLGGVVKISKWYHYLVYFQPRKSNLWIPYLFQKLIFDCRYYTFKGNPFKQWFDKHSREKRAKKYFRVL
jgi:hypothetical protein